MSVVEDERAAPPVVVVGAGLAGALLAGQLGRRGYRVDVYDRRPDPRARRDEAARSINLALSQRGVRVLQGIGLMDALWQRTAPMRGRAIHRDGEVLFQPYGSGVDEVLHSIRRTELNVALIEHAEAQAGVRFVFGAKFTGLDRAEVVARFTEEATGEEFAVGARAVIGADGVFSAVRRELWRGERADLHQEFLPWGYKELTIPPRDDGGPALRRDAFHVWPSDAGMVVAQPNADNSFVGTVFLPLEGAESFAALSDGAAAERFFAERFPGAAAVIPALAEEFGRNPVGDLVAVRVDPWVHEGKVALIGDACHAVYPFYGQGMNAAFEDCVELDACIGRNPDDWATAFAEYQRNRKRHTDVLADLSARHFVELREHVRSPLFQFRKKVDLVLQRAFPRAWKSLYTMVSHTTTPYADALTRAQRQDKLVKWTGIAAAVGAALSIRALRGRGR